MIRLLYFTDSHIRGSNPPGTHRRFSRSNEVETAGSLETG